MWLYQNLTADTMVASVCFRFGWLLVFGLGERGEDEDKGDGDGGCCRIFRWLMNGGVAWRKAG